jgi:hypothetical protein
MKSIILIIYIAQVNLHGSILDRSSTETQSQDVEILLRKSKTLIDRWVEILKAFTIISRVNYHQ